VRFHSENLLPDLKKTWLLLVFLIPATFLTAQPVVLVVYQSETGNTRQMANAVAEGAGSVDGIEVRIQTVEETSEKDLLDADAIILGSPVYNANVSPVVSEFIASWPFEGAPLRNKIGAAFVTGGGISAGEEIVQMNIIQSMLIFGMIIVGGPDWTQPFGASAITGEYPFDTDSSDTIAGQFLEKGTALGERVARITADFKNQ
jgi:NAD(P)H dehydrogenase (quinone)